MIFTKMVGTIVFYWIPMYEWYSFSRLCFFALGGDMGNLLKANKVKLYFFQVGLRDREVLIRQKIVKRNIFFL